MFRDLSPSGPSDQSVRGPLRGPRGQGPRQSDKTQQRPPSQCARWLCKKFSAEELLKKPCCVSLITRWNGSHNDRRRRRKKRERAERNKRRGVKIFVKLLKVSPAKNICRGREVRGRKNERKRRKREKGNRPFTTLKRKRLWSEREKIFTQGISSGSLCACRALVPWLHFKAQVAQLELPPGQA